MLLHSSGESFKPPIRGSPTYAVALAAKNEEQLLRLEQQLIEHDIPHVAFREPDLPWDGQLMSIGIVPNFRARLKKFTKKFPLLGAQNV